MEYATRREEENRRGREEGRGRKSAYLVAAGVQRPVFSTAGCEERSW